MFPNELIEAARSGASADVERLLEVVWPDAYRLARSIVGQDAGAQDVAQDACVRVYRGITSLRSTNAFRTWFYRIVVREALKQKKARAATLPLSSQAAYVEDRCASVDLWRALASLPDGLRTVVVLTYFEDLSGREVAAVLRVPEATVRFRLMTARRRLLPLLCDSDPYAAKGEELYAR
jgi:RNA polymerase sigma-70 factor (ECF subfamily)